MPKLSLKKKRTINSPDTGDTQLLRVFHKREKNTGNTGRSWVSICRLNILY